MNTRRLVLYGYWRSSSAYRVRLALAAKGLAYDAVAVNLLEGEQDSANHKRRNPMGYVPCLLVDGVPYGESVAIVELLEELYPDPPLYPKDANGRARVRALVEVINSGTQPLQNLHVLRKVGDHEAQKAWTQYFIPRGLAAFEEMMAQNEARGVAGPFVYGDRLGAADVWLLPQLYAARRFKVDVTPYVRLLRAERAALANEALHAAHPDAQADAVREAR